MQEKYWQGYVGGRAGDGQGERSGGQSHPKRGEGLYFKKANRQLTEDETEMVKEQIPGGGG